jgi:hypothetical protein
LAFAFVVCGSLSQSHRALADSQAELDTAKQLGTDALKLYDAHDYAGALAKFDEADTHARVPTLDLYAARCLDKLHRLLESKKRYDEVIRAVLPVGSSQKWIDAQSDAKTELAALEPRIPSVTVHPTGAGDRKVSLSIDEHDVPEVDGPHQVDAGSHKIVVVVSGKEYRRDVALNEGDHPSLDVAIDPEPTPAPIHDNAKPSPPPPSGVSGLVVAGAATLSVGAAGLIVWGATGGAAIAKASAAHCDSNGVCPHDAGTLHALRTASMASFYAGLPLAVIGSTLLVVSAVTSHGPRTTARIGPLGASLEVSF